MLTDDLSNAKVIDFSYSTPLTKSEFDECPDILKGYLSGTKQFMAPEQMPKEKFPLMDDFSKIDVFALGVFLTNMLTLDFAFENCVDDSEKYKRFLNNPKDFFESHGVEFYDEDELNDICDLL
jgi:serine/threonine protein kinase